MEVVCSLKMLIDFQWNTQHYTQQTQNRTHSCAVLTEARCSNFIVDSVEFLKSWLFVVSHLYGCRVFCYVVCGSVEHTIIDWIRFNTNLPSSLVLMQQVQDNLHFLWKAMKSGFTYIIWKRNRSHYNGILNRHHVQRRPDINQMPKRFWSCFPSTMSLCITNLSPQPYCQSLALYSHPSVWILETLRYGDVKIGWSIMKSYLLTLPMGHRQAQSGWTPLNLTSWTSLHCIFTFHVTTLAVTIYSVELLLLLLLLLFIYHSINPKSG
jgi:hypothetical protein